MIREFFEGVQSAAITFFWIATVLTLGATFGVVLAASTINGGLVWW